MTRGLACAATVWLALALALAGCGGESGEVAAPKVKATGTAPPAPPPDPPLAYTGEAKAALAGGAIAVADSSWRVAIEPSQMDVNTDQRLSQLRWSGWGSDRASGRGDVRTLICEPTCAQGVFEDSRAELVLSEPKRCGGQRFYSRASMTYEDPKTKKTRAPATYLRTPC